MPRMSTSHRNLFAEAWASAEYLEHTAEERKRIARLAVDLKGGPPRRQGKIQTVTFLYIRLFFALGLQWVGAHRAHLSRLLHLQRGHRPQCGHGQPALRSSCARNGAVSQLRLHSECAWARDAANR